MEDLGRINSVTKIRFQREVVKVSPWGMYGITGRYSKVCKFHTITINKFI